ncbi:hypothetical protein [Nostoc sp.]|uniref:hypothetical protein n=1 Tax=Nostoc sp. TaxID=1180 RepID=UPI002FF5B103
MEKLNIPVSEWQEISFEPEEGVTPLPMNESHLEQIVEGLKEALEEAFFPKHN